MDTSTIVIAIVAFVLAAMFLRKRNIRYRLPPGPMRLPLVGTMHYNPFRIDRGTEIHKLYGPVSTHYGGSKRFIMLTSFDVMSEIGSLSTCSDRGKSESYIATTFTPSMKGFFCQDYTDRFKLQRSRCSMIMKNLGMGRQMMESKICKEVDTLIESFVDFNGNDFDPWYMITSAVTNVLFSVLVSERFEHNDPAFLDFIKTFEQGFVTNKFVRYVDSGLGRVLKLIPPFKGALQKVGSMLDNTTDYMWQFAEKHFETFQDNPDGDFIDRWLNQNVKQPVFDMEDLRRMLFDLYVAGSDTTATSLKWTLIQLANRQDIQDKLFEEIDNVIGTEKNISLKDRDNLPYLNAFIWEIQRCFTITPISIAHYARSDTKIGEYDIPAKTAILFNLHAMHMNEESFGDPEVFRPERYLDEQGIFMKHAHVNPFGIGKRSCMGEMLAKQELFLFTAGLVQRLEFKPPVGSNKIDDEGIQSFTFMPKRFDIRAIPRNS